MKFGNRIIRFAIALSIAGAISAQVPMRGGTALAQDGYGGGGGGGRPIVQAAVFALVAYGIYSTVAGGGAGVPPPPPPPGTPGAPGTTPGTTPAGAVTPVPGSQPIWDVCNDNEDLNAFAKAADAAGQKENLRKSGQYTAFVPNNAAFAAVPAETLADLQKPENKDRFAALIGAHVVEGSYTIEQLKTEASKAGVDGLKLTTINGQTMTVTNDATGLKVNGVTVTETDIPASNGQIHPIGSVLTPAAGAAAPAAPATPETPAGGTATPANPPAGTP